MNGTGRDTESRLYRHDTDTALDLADQLEAFRADYNHVRPHEAIAWNRPADVHARLADPTVPSSENIEILPTT